MGEQSSKVVNLKKGIRKGSNTPTEYYSDTQLKDPDNNNYMLLTLYQETERYEKFRYYNLSISTSDTQLEYLKREITLRVKITKNENYLYRWGRGFDKQK